MWWEHVAKDCHYHSTKCGNLSLPITFIQRKCYTMLLKYSPPRKVPSTPGANNLRHISGGFPICSLHIIFGVVIVVATGTAHFPGQATLNDDSDLLWNWVCDLHSRSLLDDHTPPCDMDRQITRHFAGNGQFPAIYLDDTKKGKEEGNQINWD